MTNKPDNQSDEHDALHALDQETRRRIASDPILGPHLAPLMNCASEAEQEEQREYAATVESLAADPVVAALVQLADRTLIQSLDQLTSNTTAPEGDQ